MDEPMLQVGDKTFNLRLDFFLCPNHGLIVPRCFYDDWDTEQGCPVPTYDEEPCEEPLTPVYLDHLTPRHESGNGISLIAAERQRQIDEENRTAEHDDQHIRNELAIAASVYASPSNGSWKVMNWPWEEESIRLGHSHQMRIRELSKAGALCAAEIDRLERVRISSAIEDD